MESREPTPEKGRSFLPPRVEILRLDFSRLARPVPVQAVEGRDDEVGRVVKRLLAILREYRGSARRVGSPLDGAALREVVQALRIESFGGDHRALLHHPDPVAAWLRASLFQELVEEPSNVLFTTRLDEETVRYEAMETAFWRECLAALEERLPES